MSEEEKVVVEDVMASTVHKDGDPIVSAKTLLNAGVHFGHKVSRWNPKMKKFIYGKKKSIHILDLNKSVAQLNNAYVALKDIVSKGGKVLFVGTKAYAQQAIQEEAVRSGSFYVAHRWLGGTLTNFHTIAKRIALLRTIEAEELNGDLEKLPKKEAADRLKLKAKLAANLEGIKEIRMIPNALVVVDPTTEHNAVAEAKLLNIPVFALGDTNTDPDAVDYLIPANDDGEASIRIIVGLLADAVVEGKGGEPLYAYKDAAEAAGTMSEMMKGYDPAEELKTIRNKLKNDTLAMRKNGKKSSKKRFVKKFNRDEKPAEENAENREAASEPAKAEEEAK